MVQSDALQNADSVQYFQIDSAGKSKGTTGTYLLLCALLGMIGAYVGIMVADRLWIAVFGRNAAMCRS